MIDGRRLLFVVAVAWLAETVSAQAPSPQPASPAPSSSPPPCSAPEHRQFDFWLGEWEVRTPKGNVAGANRIESILQGCALHEHWSGARGLKGESLNTYDPADRRWHQMWVDESGTVLHLAGAFDDGRMVLEGSLPAAGKDGANVRQRITWEKLDDGRVRQLWESSEDGQVWKVVFDGLYSRRSGSGSDR